MTYLGALIKKIRVHANNRKYEGNFSLDAWFKSLQRQNQQPTASEEGSPIHPKAIGLLINLIQELENVQKILFLQQFSHSSCVAGVLGPLAQESYNVFQTISYGLFRVLAENNDISSVIPIYNNVYSNLKNFLDQTQSVGINLTFYNQFPQVLFFTFTQFLSNT